jgi:phage-related protein
MYLFKAEYTDEALEQYENLDLENQVKILGAISIFEQIGTAYKNINTLGDGLFEIKPKGVRAYFRYHNKKIIIVGFITLKKTQKAPKRYIEQANTNIDNHIKKENKNEE